MVPAPADCTDRPPSAPTAGGSRIAREAGPERPRHRVVVSPKDFVRARGDLWFAVLSEQLEDTRVLAFLRYARDRQGHWQKTDSIRADALMQRIAPHYLYHCTRLDTRLHGIPHHEIDEVMRPRAAARRLIVVPDPDPVQRAAIKAIKLLRRGGVPAGRLGVTGSLMLGLQGPRSDVDLVIYGREHFHIARRLVAETLKTAAASSLTMALWRDAYARRRCSLRFPDYLRHEQRKLNKFSVDSVKIDISMVLAPADKKADLFGPCRKAGRGTITARVTDDRYAFDLPARYPVEHDEIEEIVACTHTYAGQARAGERVTASGVVEVDDRGRRRLVVGTSREAGGEYLRVVEWRS